MPKSLKKYYGQHFLRDPYIIDHIVNAVAPAEQDHCVEIGPGDGAITFPLLQRLHKLQVIEIDRDLIEPLKKRGEKIGDLTIHVADVLKVDFHELQTNQQPLKIVGNLPYYISTPLIFHLLTDTTVIESMVLMLQKEVAERITAAHDTEHYGRLSIMVQYHCRAEILFFVPATAFTPPPKVESAVIKLVPHKQLPYLATDYSLFSAIVKQAFGQRRKTLRNSLQQWMDTDKWAQIDLRSDRRPENLSVQQFVELSNFLTQFSL